MHMLRFLVYGLAVLHLGPAAAFAIHAFGCEGIDPALGNGYCEPMIASFAWTTVAAWLILSVGAVVAAKRRDSQGAGTVS